ncbi:uncharacterized protein LOC114558355 [Tachysurus ichikawai]
MLGCSLRSFNSKSLPQSSSMLSQKKLSVWTFIHVPSELQTIRGKMKIHQITSASPSQMSWRILSCFCSAPHDCKCFNQETVMFQHWDEASPLNQDDIIWYQTKNIIGLIPEPVPVTKRHKEIVLSVWEEICETLN